MRGVGRAALTLVRRLELGGWHMPAWRVEAPLIPPLDPGRRRKLDLTGRPPGPPSMDQLGLEEAVHRLGKRVIAVIRSRPVNRPRRPRRPPPAARCIGCHSGIADRRRRTTSMVAWRLLAAGVGARRGSSVLRDRAGRPGGRSRFCRRDPVPGEGVFDGSRPGLGSISSCA